MKRFIGYADKFGKRIQSLCVAEFDTANLKKEEQSALEEYEEGDGTWDYFLDSLRPMFYYYAMDFSNDPPIIFINQPDPVKETWPVECRDIYKTIDDAKEAMLGDLKMWGLTPQQALIKVIMERED